MGMGSFFLQVTPEGLTNTLGSAASEVAEGAIEQAAVFAGNPAVLAGGVGLIIAAVLLILFLKRIIINSILGIILWAIIVYVFKLELPFVASLVVSLVFGLAGIGALLVLKFLAVF